VTAGRWDTGTGTATAGRWDTGTGTGTAGRWDTGTGTLGLLVVGTLGLQCVCIC